MPSSPSGNWNLLLLAWAPKQSPKETKATPTPPSLGTYTHSRLLFLRLLACLLLYAWNRESHLYTYPKERVPLFLEKARQLQGRLTTTEHRTSGFLRRALAFFLELWCQKSSTRQACRASHSGHPSDRSNGTSAPLWPREMEQSGTKLPSSGSGNKP